ncbi:putative amino acid permease [Streptomyces badius]
MAGDGGAQLRGALPQFGQHRIAWYLIVNQISANALFDSLTALSLLIAFYYALTGVACAVYYRRHLTESLRNFLLIGLGPVVGAGLLTWLLVRSVIDMSDPANSYSGTSWFGLGPPLVIGIAIALAGVVLMVVRRLRDAAFWQERPGVADPDLVHAPTRKGP